MKQIKLILLCTVLSLTSQAQELYSNINNQSLTKTETGYCFSFQDNRYTTISSVESICFNHSEVSTFQKNLSLSLSGESIETTNYRMIKQGGAVLLYVGSAYTYVSKRAITKLKEAIK